MCTEWMQHNEKLVSSHIELTRYEVCVILGFRILPRAINDFFQCRVHNWMHLSIEVFSKGTRGQHVEFSKFL